MTPVKICLFFYLMLLLGMVLLLLFRPGEDIVEEKKCNHQPAKDCDCSFRSACEFCGQKIKKIWMDAGGPHHNRGGWWQWVEDPQ
jgi:hypothetical protein